MRQRFCYPSIHDIKEKDPRLITLLNKFSGQPFHVNCNYSYFNPEHKEIKKLYFATSFPFFWDGNEAVTLLLDDITDQESIISLKIADENKDRALSTVSHELRTPISVILNMLGMAEKYVNNPELFRYFDICKSNAGLLLNLVNSILDLNQIRAGKIKITKEDIDIREILYGIISMFELPCSQKGIQIKLQLDHGLPHHLHTDKNRFRQIIINLVSNALKFTFKGSITIGANLDSEDHTKVWFWVQDTGIGIKDEDKSKLFKAFGKLEDSANINTGGVGLGLSISNRLVKLLNDNEPDSFILLESEYGKGSKFMFYLRRTISIKSIHEEDANGIEEFEANLLVDTQLPHSLLEGMTPGLNKDIQLRRFDAFPSLHSIENPHEIHISLNSKLEIASLTLDRGKRVLLVDDNPFNLLFPCEIFKQKGWDCVVAHNGKEAIDIIQENHKSIDLVLMDCEMPILDGFEATSILKEKMYKKEITNIPIYALSANDSEQDKQRCKNIGMDGYIMKPLNENEINRILDQLRI